MYLIASHFIFLHRLIFLILRLWIILIQFIWNNYNDVLGEVIYQIRGDERGWCYGRIACKEGIYPSNTVRLLTMNIFGVWIQIHTRNSNSNDNTVYHIDIGICLFFSYLSLFMCLMINLFVVWKWISNYFVILFYNHLLLFVVFIYLVSCWTLARWLFSK